MHAGRRLSVAASAAEARPPVAAAARAAEGAEVVLVEASGSGLAGRELGVEKRVAAPGPAEMSVAGGESAARLVVVVDGLVGERGGVAEAGARRAVVGLLGEADGLRGACSACRPDRMGLEIHFQSGNRFRLETGGDTSRAVRSVEALCASYQAA